MYVFVHLCCHLLITPNSLIAQELFWPTKVAVDQKASGHQGRVVYQDVKTGEWKPLAQIAHKVCNKTVDVCTCTVCMVLDCASNIRSIHNAQHFMEESPAILFEATIAWFYFVIFALGIIVSFVT